MSFLTTGGRSAPDRARKRIERGARARFPPLDLLASVRKAGWPVGALALLLLVAVAGPARDALALELYYTDAAGALLPFPPPPAAPTRTLPVLFVHGHDLVADQLEAVIADPSTSVPRRILAQQFLDGREDSHIQSFHAGDVSFQTTLDAQENQVLDVEPYYIHFADRHRSMEVDAAEIREAIGLILQRHDPSFSGDLDDTTSTTHVKVAIIAFSKGTLSARLALKSLDEPVAGLGQARPDLRPVAEFIAISPPNHGVRPSEDFDNTTSVALRQLFNGYKRDCTSYGDATQDFIENLNGHDIGHTMLPAGSVPPSFAEEAPGSRTNGAGLVAGTLYAQIFAAGNADRVGGNTTSNDCQGREVASNLAPDAVDVLVSGIADAGIFGNLVDDNLVVHANTVHTAGVVCIALYTAIHHRLPQSLPTSPCTASTGSGQPVVPPPPVTTVVLALDHSGSMLSLACATCAPRLDYLEDAVSLFLDMWVLVATPEDHVSVAYFRTHVDPVQPLPVPLRANRATLLSAFDVPPVVSQNMTAMGGAIHSGLASLAGFGPNRHVIVFTDGIQNVNPMIAGEGGPPEDLFFENEIGRPQSNVAVPSGTTLVDAAQGTRVEVIGVIDVRPVLDDIAIATGGVAKLTTDITLLRQFFVEQLMNTLRGTSPQLLAYRRGTLAGDSMTETFAVGLSARQVILQLAWPRGASFDFSVEKDGVDLTASARIVEAATHRVLAFDPPFAGAGPSTGTAGEWRMRISGVPGTPYEAAAIVDETRLSIRPSLVAGTRRAGEPIALRVAVLDGDRPVDEGLTVSARIERAGQSLTNLLATLPADAQPTRAARLEPMSSPGQAALARLLEDDATWERLAPVAEEIRLASRGKGIYEGSFAATSTQGPYSIAFRVTGATPDLGAIERIETLSTRVRVAAPDPAWSRLAAERVDAPRSTGRWELHIEPRDRFGNYLGPDRGGDIEVRSKERDATIVTRDRGNGAYAVSIEVPGRDDAELSVRVAGVELFSGPIADLTTGGDGRHPLALIVAALVLALAALAWFVLRRRHRPAG